MKEIFDWMREQIKTALYKCNVLGYEMALSNPYLIGIVDEAEAKWKENEAELRANVIDEFAKKIRDWKKEIYTNERYVGELDFLFKHIDEIASQMKGEKE